MDCIRIFGGRALRGTIRIHGSKNAALPILTATACIPGLFRLENCPAIRDVEVTREILAGLNIESRWSSEALLVDSRGVRLSPVSPLLAGQLRASSLFLGALTGRFGLAEIPLPGGCVLGARPLDLHLSALSALGADLDCAEGLLRCKGPLRGGTAVLRYPSVGATENTMLAALGAAAPVRILGAAREPEIVALADFLRACGAEISGAGSSAIEIRPAALQAADCRILPDRMEAVTWLCAAACTGGSLSLTELRPDQLEPVLTILRRAGCEIRMEADRVVLRAGALRSVGPLVTGPWPAFPTDAQPPLLAALTRAEGITVFEETVFERRFRHVPGLLAMGADIELAGRLARIRGVEHLHGARVEAPDLRGGAALLCAALAAEGESLLTNAALLERGYQDLIPSLRAVGAELQAESSGAGLRMTEPEAGGRRT